MKFNYLEWHLIKQAKGFRSIENEIHQQNVFHQQDTIWLLVVTTNYPMANSPEDAS